MFFPSIESPCKSYLTGYIYNLPGKLDHHILKPLALLSRVPGVCCDHAVTMLSPGYPRPPRPDITITHRRASETLWHPVTRSHDHDGLIDNNCILVIDQFAMIYSGFISK